MKTVGKAVAEDVWTASVSRSSHEIYKKDREEQKERAKSWRPDSLQVNAERIKRGELVGEEYLWGRRAVQMIKMGMVLESTLELHRQSFLEDYRSLYTKDFYDIKVKELNTKHSLAKEQYTLT
jgi:hypothetical protein